MNKLETLEILKDLGRDRFSVLSEWVIELRAEYTKTVGYPYIDSVRDWIIKTHGLTLNETETKNLGTLVYNASKESRKRQDLADGFLPLTEDRIQALIGKQCQYRSESLFGDSLVQGKIVKAHNGQYAFLPKGKRTKGYWIHGESKIREVA